MSEKLIITEDDGSRWVPIEYCEEVESQLSASREEVARLRKAISLASQMAKNYRDAHGSERNITVEEEFDDVLAELIDNPSTSSPAPAKTCRSEAQDFVLTKYPKASACCDDDGLVLIMNWGGPTLSGSFDSEESAWNDAAQRLGKHIEEVKEETT